MPAKSSDIHEASVIYSFTPESRNIFSFNDFALFSKKISNGCMNISKEDFKKYKETYERGQALGLELKSALNLKGNTFRWVGLENHTTDSTDIIIDNKKISLKDSSKIVRNNGFEQLLRTFRKDFPAIFKDPFLQFSPKLSTSYIHTIIKANIDLGHLKVKGGIILLEDTEFALFNGNLNELYALDLKSISKIFKAKHIKELVKRFVNSKYQQELLKIRLSIVNDVSKKVVAVLQEGIFAKDGYVDEQFKSLFQYTSEVKFFGFSSTKFNHVGAIVSKDKAILNVNKVYSRDSKLQAEATGLQINLYTEVDITIEGLPKKEITIENQLRYKHRTFSCAPEANTHLTSFDTWKDIYPLIKKFI